MSEKISQFIFEEKLKLAYPDNKICITEWNGYTKQISFLCDRCGNVHTISDARQLLNKQHYCSKYASKNTKWDLSSYNERINNLFHEHIEILEYNGLSNPIKYKCPRCNTTKVCNPARTLLTRLSLCDDCYGVEKNQVKAKIDALFAVSDKYQLLVWRGVKNKLTMHCNNCGATYDRYPSNAIACFDSCPQCNSGAKKHIIDDNTMQARLDNTFGDNKYQLLDYTGSTNSNNKIKCLDCGFIFTTNITSFIGSSRGCPHCKRFKSKGEQRVQHFLESNHITFEGQKRFIDCNNGLSSFDFCAYDSNNKMYLIEVNGIQHYKPVKRFGDLETIQKRDSIKINYCLNNNIPLIIIPYTDLSDTSISNYLSFLKGSTTIPEGSRK